MGEFELINRYFRRERASEPGRPLELGIGDDCALLRPAPGTRLAVSSDMLVEGRHFLSTVDPARLGHKSLAVNLSDLAAVGARPLAFTLALALPRADEAWARGFSEGLFALADAHACVLAGGDTTQGPLNICITIFGELPGDARALLRSSARPGDDLYVSGAPGEARAALEVFRGTLALDAQAFAHARDRMERPTPRVQLGQALLGVAHAAIDVSDGLLGDLGHVLAASGVGASITLDTVREQLIASSPVLAGLPPDLALEFVLAGGDDYELVFTAAATQRDAVARAAMSAGVTVTRMGRIDAQQGLRLIEGDGRLLTRRFQSFDHFA